MGASVSLLPSMPALTLQAFDFLSMFFGEASREPSTEANATGNHPLFAATSSAELAMRIEELVDERATLPGSEARLLAASREELSKVFTVPVVDKILEAQRDHALLRPLTQSFGLPVHHEPWMTFDAFVGDPTWPRRQRELVLDLAMGGVAGAGLGHAFEHGRKLPPWLALQLAEQLGRGIRRIPEFFAEVIRLVQVGVKEGSGAPLVVELGASIENAKAIHRLADGEPPTAWPPLD